MCCVYVPTNHLYIGDIFLVNSNDVIRPNLSVREGIGMPIFLPCLHILDIIIFASNIFSYVFFALMLLQRLLSPGYVNATSSIDTGN